jgi:hypothetical protein
METMELKEKQEFKLPNKKVTVQIIDKPWGRHRDKSHQMYNLHPMSDFTICVPKNRLGDLVNPLTEVERKYMENTASSGLSFKPGELSVYNDKGKEFWNSKAAKVRLTRNDLVLDLSDPMDYIRYKILLVNTFLIAPSYEDRFKKPSYRFMLVHDEEILSNTISDAEILTEAYTEFGAIKNNPDALKDVLTVLGKKPAKTTKLNFLVAEVAKFLETNKGRTIFLETIKDPNYKLKLLLRKAVAERLVNVSNNKYYLEGGDPMCLTGKVNNIEGAIEYLDHPSSQDVLLYLKSKITE